MKNHHHVITQISSFASQKATAFPCRRLAGLFVFLGLTINASAQPLPPTTPSGNPVPVEGILTVLSVALFTLGITKLRKKSKRR